MESVGLRNLGSREMCFLGGKDDGSKHWGTDGGRRMQILEFAWKKSLPGLRLVLFRAPETRAAYLASRSFFPIDFGYSVGIALTSFCASALGDSASGICCSGDS